MIPAVVPSKFEFRRYDGRAWYSEPAMDPKTMYSLMLLTLFGYHCCVHPLIDAVLPHSYDAVAVYSYQVPVRTIYPGYTRNSSPGFTGLPARFLAAWYLVW